MTSPLTDGAARARIKDDTAATLFVEAGAGSGKTKSLVDRVRTLVLSDGVPMTNIAAVTFTEKAGAELRDRLRAAFEEEWRTEARGRADRAERALADLDSAAIGTLHSFAQRILSTYPIQAGLPPLIEVLDEVGSSVAFDERWSVLQRELLDGPSISRDLLRGMDAGITLRHLRSLMRAFNSDWDLVEDRVLVDHGNVPAPDLAPLADEATRLGVRATECRDPGDRFLADLAAIGEWGASLRAADDDAGRFALLRKGCGLKTRHGRKDQWPDLAGLKADCKDLIARIKEAHTQLSDAVIRPLARWMARRVVDSAAHRAADGRLEFHDLLVLARRLLRTDPDVRASLREQYQRLLLDEFQDTDPIQIELALRIAAGRDGDAVDWTDIPIPPGSLFVVGDPKQSIYRFRRADSRMYLAAQHKLGGSTDLITNFRTTAPIVSWVNRVFGQLMTAEPGMQPAYQALVAHRSEPGVGPSVTVLGAEPHAEGDADALRAAEAADVAAIVGRALADGWTVLDPGDRQWRLIRPADIAILLPARTSLPFLRNALDAAGIAYTAESSSLVYQAAEIRDLMATIRAVADPADRFATVTALRSPLFGCGDDDLWSWRSPGGRFNILTPVPAEQTDHPVGRALTYLRGLHYRARWLTPSELLAAVIDERRMLEVAATGPRARDAWRRLRFVVDQARAWSEAEYGGLRAYLAWASRQADQTARVAEAVLQETDVDAVRIMTVHAAKGLEFGMVVLSGLTSRPRKPAGVQVIWPPTGGYAMRLTKDIETNDFEAVLPVDEQMDAHERIRLLYVATTRARDHLVVSLHRLGKGPKTSAMVLAAAGAAEGADSFAGEPLIAGAPVMRADVEPPPDWEAWQAWLTAAQQASRHRPTVSASGLEGTEPDVVLPTLDGADPAVVDPGAAKGARDVELPPWSKGRYGSAVGRAVHGALQTVDLSTGDGLKQAVTAQCFAEGVTDYQSLVSDLVRSALNSDIVRAAAARSPLRESFVASALDDGTVLEGIIDLLFRDDDGTVVIVDYKTDAAPAAALPARAEFYRPQMRAYRQALEAATGAETRAVLLFLHPQGSHAVEVDTGAGAPAH